MNLRSLLLPAAAALIATAAFAAAPKITDVNEALSKAQTENKMVFMQYGREACGNCQATKKMVREGKIPVTADAFVAADLNIDDQRVQASFMQKYQKEKFGNTLPFVVITDSHGKALASSGGYKAPEAWSALIEEAKKKIAAKSGAR